MSATIVNLRSARKAKRRADDEALAAANRGKHGRTKAERATTTLEGRRSARVLDGARLDRPSQDPLDG